MARLLTDALLVTMSSAAYAKWGKQLTVLVTGATVGLGAAAARRFAHEGHKVVITGRRLELLETLKTELSTSFKTPVHILCFDVADRAAVDKAIKSLPADFANVSVLVNNAGLALGLEPAYKADLDDWDKMIGKRAWSFPNTNNRVIQTPTARASCT